MTTYKNFIDSKKQIEKNYGFKPIFVHDDLFEFQNYLVDWSLRKGRSAIFADCGLGKTPIQLVWAENIVRKTNKRVLILTPLAVSAQTIEEGIKFGIDCKRSKIGKFKSSSKIIVTNYERLKYFNPNDFEAVVCDESSILKNFKGVYKNDITKFMHKIKYRLLCTATASPNDYTELGTSSEALGYLGYIDMLQKFFKANDNSYAQGGTNQKSFVNRKPLQDGKFRFRGHAEDNFWRWVSSWARTIRKPSDFGYEDNDFILPELKSNLHVIQNRVVKKGYLIEPPNRSLREQREERRRTLPERCEKAAEITNNTKDFTICWCNLNDESKMLSKLIDNSVEVTGSDPEEKKEEAFIGFKKGEFKVLVTKSLIAGMGMNFQHCQHQTFFPTHSFEQWYQSIRRSWRFGQKNAVTIDMIASEGETEILKNLNRKEKAAQKMYDEIVRLMGNALEIKKDTGLKLKEEIPSWL